MVTLKTTHKETGKVYLSHGHKREELEAWIKHQHDNIACRYMQYEIIEGNQND